MTALDDYEYFRGSQTSREVIIKHKIGAKTCKYNVVKSRRAEELKTEKQLKYFGINTDKQHKYYRITLEKKEELQEAKKSVTVRRQAQGRRIDAKEQEQNPQTASESITEGQKETLKQFSEVLLSNLDAKVIHAVMSSLAASNDHQALKGKDFTAEELLEAMIQYLDQ